MLALFMFALLQGFILGIIQQTMRTYGPYL